MASIREEHNEASMATIRWIPSWSLLADALTKDNKVVSRLLDDILKSGLYNHSETLYTSASTTTIEKRSGDVPARTQASDSLADGQSLN